MSRIKIKIFTSNSKHYNNEFGERMDELLNFWIDDREEIEIIDCELKMRDNGENGGALIVKYRESTYRKLRVEKRG